ncbi:MAG: simple sugar transport system substrate-binding protein [Solirubrobacteraceae bacterium]|nr:simple sugar transport system substrate-binding protein [Solirubrobacteraceae bacterium]
MRRSLLACALAVLLAGCGTTAEEREPDLVSDGPGPGVSTPQRTGPQSSRAGVVRIAIVTHGQASSAFWATVRNGIDAAARQMDVAVGYRSPDVYSVSSMRRLIDAAIATRPDGLVVSIPDPALAGAIRRAVRAGIPVVSINSGSDLYRRLGVLAHVGQPEGQAGLEAGRRLAAAGVRHALCVNQEVGNIGLDRRCRSFGRAIRAAGGTSRVLAIDLNDTVATQRRLTRAVASSSVDGVLTLNSGGAQAALDAIVATGREREVPLGTFDLSPDVLDAVRVGRIRFAIDQQAYLQGYLPVMLLGQYARYGLFAAQGDVIPTGPHFVTRENAAQAIRLSRRGIR